MLGAVGLEMGRPARNFITSNWFPSPQIHFNPHYITLYYKISHNATLHYITLHYYTTLYFMESNGFPSSPMHFNPQYISLQHYITRCHTTQHNTILWYIMLHYSVTLDYILLNKIYLVHVSKPTICPIHSKPIPFALLWAVIQWIHYALNLILFIQVSF